MKKCVDCANNGVPCKGDARGFACMRFTRKSVRSVEAGEDAEPMCDDKEFGRALRLCVLEIEYMRQTDDEVCRRKPYRTALDLARSWLKKAGERWAVLKSSLKGFLKTRGTR